jgi:hypothetical protein
VAAAAAANRRANLNPSPTHNWFSSLLKGTVRGCFSAWSLLYTPLLQ